MRSSINKTIDAIAAVALIILLFAPLAGPLGRPHGHAHVTAMHASTIAGSRAKTHPKQ